MNDMTPDPDACTTLAEVFAAVDAIDRALIENLSRRFAYTRAAARIEQDRAEQAEELRRKSTIATARQQAFDRGVPVGLVGDFWDRLFDASVAYERQARARIHQTN
ncbi:chorismate mutase [Novosphingobium lentum]|uniref:chorismate mutase n=1 Tax=Novosphingobium lentum TaxID=145287 RepID=UPI0008328CF9|nr:chorismate mutase [Novosphingobium lentum]